MNADGSPSETVAAGYVWAPGTEIAEPLGDGPLASGNGRDDAARQRARNGAEQETRP